LLGAESSGVKIIKTIPNQASVKTSQREASLVARFVRNQIVEAK
jgi:hypothetical protein